MRIACVVAVALTVAWTNAASAQPAGKKLQVCSLLTASEVSAVGASGAGQDSEIMLTQGVAKGQPMRMCGWQVPPQGSVMISVVQPPPGARVNESAAHDAEIAQMGAAFKGLKEQGWQEEIKDFGSVRCVSYTPPATVKSPLVSTGCFGIAKGNGVSVGANTKTKTSIDAVKSLLDKLVARLP